MDESIGILIGIFGIVLTIIFGILNISNKNDQPKIVSNNNDLYEYHHNRSLKEIIFIIVLSVIIICTVICLLLEGLDTLSIIRLPMAYKDLGVTLATDLGLFCIVYFFIHHCNSKLKLDYITNFSDILKISLINSIIFSFITSFYIIITLVVFYGGSVFNFNLDIFQLICGMIISIVTVGAIIFMIIGVPISFIYSTIMWVKYNKYN